MEENITKNYIDLKNWSRAEHFQFFSQFEEPFWGSTVDLDCSKAYVKAKSLHTSFFLYYLHKSLLAVNETDEFRYRIDSQGKPFIYDSINASATINRANGTFGFSHIVFDRDYNIFESNAKKEIERVQMANSLMPVVSADNVIHYSSLPWLKFTALSHARNFAHKDSVPKISFGRMTKEGEKMTMPVSIHVHHGLVDGVHVGQYCERFQALLDA